MCIFGTLAKNRKYEPNKKNGGVAPPLKDTRTAIIPIGCGKCIECMREKAREWGIRLNEDIKDYKNGIFVTMTFSDKSIMELAKEVTKRTTRVKTGIKSIKKDKNGKEIKRYKYKTYNTEIKLNGYETDNAIATLAVDRFNERWRKKYGKAIRHWLVTELGHENCENIHLHGILYTNETIEAINERWSYGKVWGGYENKRSYVNGATVTYVTKYITKMDVDHKEYKPKILNSPGIGAGWLKRQGAKLAKYNGEQTKDYYRDERGYKRGLPIYYRNKIYTDEEREKLWVMKLDKNIRYVNGIKVAINKGDGDEEYYKLLKEAQIINRRLGYGEKTDWERKRYEDDRRNKLTKKRIERADPSGTLRGLGTAPESAESILGNNEQWQREW